MIWDKQAGICPYTGIQLNLVDADIDHIVPRAKGGTNDPNNLQFILREVNEMKSAMPEADFLRIIKMVHRNCLKTGKIADVTEDLVPSKKWCCPPGTFTFPIDHSAERNWYIA